METLKLRLSAINRVKFKVIRIDGPEEKSSLPFSDGHEDTKLFSVLYALDAIHPAYEHSESDDQNWMKNEGILSEDKNVFAPTMLQTIGEKLYNALFPGSIRDELNKAIGKAGLESLHIQIQYDANTIQESNLSLYPWQLVHNGKNFLAKRGVKFSFSIACDGAKPNDKRIVKQIKVLLISSKASNNNLANENFEDKTLQINKGLTKAKQDGRACLLSWDDGERPTFERLRVYLTNHQKEPAKLPDIIHFDGHGVFKKRCDTPSCLNNHAREIIYNPNQEKCQFCPAILKKPQGFLLFEDEDGMPDYISAEDFTELVSIGKPALVVITACRSALAHKSESVFNGIAQSLLQEVPAVVATPFNISEDSIIGFIEQFYRTLGARKSLLEAVKLGSKSMRFKSYEWYRLVTFLNHRTGYLFDFDDSSSGNNLLNLASPTEGSSLGEKAGKKSISSNKYSGQLVSLDMDFFKICNSNEIIVKLNIAFGNFDRKFKFKDSHLLSFKRDKEGYIRFGIKGGKLHLKLENGSMPLSIRINKQINTQDYKSDWKVIATGDENNPTWIFETKKEQSILKGGISKEELGIINLLGNLCTVEGIFKCKIDGNDLKIIAQKGVWNYRTSKSKIETKIRAFFKYIEPELKDYLSKVTWEYD